MLVRSVRPANCPPRSANCPATARPGNKCPAVPPPASTIWIGSVFIVKTDRREAERLGSQYLLPSTPCAQFRFLRNFSRWHAFDVRLSRRRVGGAVHFQHSQSDQGAQH